MDLICSDISIQMGKSLKEATYLTSLYPIGLSKETDVYLVPCG